MKALGDLYSTLWKVALVAAGVFFAFDLFLRQTPVEVGRETTYLLEPLAEDGLPASVQLVGKPGADGLVLAAGRLLASLI
jgi:hypothetical protein